MDVAFRRAAVAGGGSRHDQRSGWGRRLHWGITLAFALTLLANFVGPGVTTRASWGATVADGPANIRSEPGTWAEVIGDVSTGDWVEILAGPTEDGWYQIASGNQMGWILGVLLDLGGGGADVGSGGWTGPTSDGGGGYTAWIDTDALNVRADASTDAEVWDQLLQGTSVTVTGGEVNGFLPVEYGGGRGWVWSGYLGFDGPTAVAAEVATASAERWIDIDRSSSRVTLYEGDQQIASYWGAMGYDQSDDGFYATAIGTYYVYSKWEPLTWTDFAGAYITEWVGFDPTRENGFHSYTMDADGNMIDGGDGPTGGCVALDFGAAAAIYNFAAIGMRVEVHW